MSENSETELKSEDVLEQLWRIRAEARAMLKHIGEPAVEIPMEHIGLIEREGSAIGYMRMDQFIELVENVLGMHDR